jgi:hypothetical protein
VIGKAKVMSYDDIVEAQIKRDAKGAGIEGRTRRAKRKNSASTSLAYKRSRAEELKEAEYEIEKSGLGSYCSVLHF